MNPLQAKYPYPLAKAFTGNIPFSDSNPTTAITTIIQGGRPERPAHPNLTESLWTVIQKCWAQNPRDRPQMSQVTEHLASSTKDIGTILGQQPGSFLGTKLVERIVSVYKSEDDRGGNFCV